MNNGKFTKYMYVGLALIPTTLLAQSVVPRISPDLDRVGSAAGGGAPTSAEFIVLTLNGTLTGERRLIVGEGLIGTDAGANGDFEIKYDPAQLASLLVSNTFTAGAKQIWQSSATTAGGRIVCAALPSSPATGDLACDSGDSNKLKIYDGTAWVAAVGGGGSPGGSGTELQYRGGASTFSALANSSVPNAGELQLGGTPTASATQALVTIGASWAGGNTAGTSLGINVPASFTGDALAVGENGTRYLSVSRDATYDYIRLGSPGASANAVLIRHGRSGSGFEMLRGDSAGMTPLSAGILRSYATPGGFLAMQVDPGVSPGSTLLTVRTAATNDDPGFEYINYRVATTDATTTTLGTIAAANSTTTFVEFRVWARRTGGTGGTAEDGAAYRGSCVFQAAAGTATQIGATTIAFEQENQNWTVGCSASAGNAIIQVTGAVNNNVTWHGEAWVRKVGS